MVDRIVRNSARLFVVLHFAAWSAVVSVWILAWQVNQDPSGPRFNFAKRFLNRIDALIAPTVEVVSMQLAQWVTSWWSADLGLAFTALFALLILLGGTLQWFVLGKLVEWVSLRYGRPPAVGLAGLGTCWFLGALFLWIAA